MKRDPAIHITKSRLAKILLDYGITKLDIEHIMAEAYRFAVRNRVMVITKSRRKVEKFTDNVTPHVEIFNRIYNGVMVGSNIKVMSIRKGSRMYLTLVEVTNQALEFCKLFNLGTETGFKIYIETGVKVLGRKYNLYRLLGSSSRIVDHFKATLVITTDTSPEKTDKMIAMWCDAVQKFFGSIVQFDSDTLTRVDFVYAKCDADSVGADYRDWMYAQFEKWAYLNHVPAFSQIYGDNAKLIYKLYMAKTKKETDDNEYLKAIKYGKKAPTKEAVEKERIREERIQAGLHNAGSHNNG